MLTLKRSCGVIKLFSDSQRDDMSGGDYFLTTFEKPCGFSLPQEIVQWYVFTTSFFIVKE